MKLVARYEVLVIIIYIYHMRVSYRLGFPPEFWHAPETPSSFLNIVKTCLPVPHVPYVAAIVHGREGRLDYC